MAPLLQNGSPVVRLEPLRLAELGLPLSAKDGRDRTGVLGLDRRTPLAILWLRSSHASSTSLTTMDIDKPKPPKAPAGDEW